MKNLRNIIKALLAAPLAIGLPIGTAHAVPQYTLTDLGTLGGSYSNGAALNEAGQVVGYSHLPSNSALHPFLWQDGIGLEDLNTLGGTYALAAGINNVGKVVGNSSIVSDVDTHGFVWTLGALGLMQGLPTLGGEFSRATAINDNDLITGSASIAGNVAERGVVWFNSVASPTDLGTLGGSNSQGNDINFIGQVVGYAEDANRVTHATLWTPPYNNPAQDLGTLGGTYSEAMAINAQGQVTGISSNTGDTVFQGFIWQAGQGMVNLGALTTTSSHTAGIDINANGDVVGYSTTAGGAAKRAIVRKAGATALADLNGLILPNTGWVLSEANAINDGGQIVGIGTLTKVDTVNNLNKVEPHAFLLTPDREKPTVTCPTTVTTTGTQPASIGTAAAQDNLDTAPVITNNRPVTFPNGDTTVVWTATDANGNAATCSQIVTVGGDRTAPIVSVAVSPATPNASGWYLVSPSITWTVTDAESAISSRAGCTNVPAVANTSPAGQPPLSCTATSAGGTSLPVTTAIIKVDTVAPVLADVPAAFTQQASSPTGAVVNYTNPTATDTFSGVSATGVSCLPASGVAFPMGSTTVNCSVSDVAGNSSSTSFVVTVADQTPPVVVFNTVPAAPAASGWFLAPVATSWSVTDAESAVTSPACTPATRSTSTASAGVNMTCSATSAGGSTGTITRTVKVDIGLPTFTAPANITRNPTGSNGAVVTYATPTATDPTPGSGLNGGVSCTPASGSTFPMGTTVVTCSARDVAGNTANRTFNVTVADNTAPLVSFVVAPAVDGLAGWYKTSPSVTWTVTDPHTPITARVGCVDQAAVGNTVGQSFSCNATSGGGTSATVATPTLRVDTIAPTFTGTPASFTRAATSAAGAVVTYTAPTATDTFSGVSAAGVSCLPASGATMPLGANAVTCSASDVAGNANSVSFVVTVVEATDQVPPVFTNCPATVTLTQGEALPLLVATDNVSTPVVTRTPAGDLSLGLTTVTWTATDAAGLSANCVQQVTVNAVVSETITVNTPQCKRRNNGGEWSVRGTNSTTNSIQLYTSATVPSDSNTLLNLGTPRTVNNGSWSYSTQNGLACTTRISLRSSAGTVQENISVRIR